MRRYFAFFAVGLVGAVVGTCIAMAFYIGHLRVVIPSHLATLEQGQEHSCMLSLAALKRLEGGDTQGTKTILAREIRSFYLSPWLPDGPHRQTIVDLIEATKPKSTVLREELRRTAP